MRKGLVRRNPWLETVRSLHGTEIKDRSIRPAHSIQKKDPPPKRQRLQKGVDGGAPPLSTIKVLECSSAISVIVSWSDPKLGHCGYQRWSLCKAVMPGRCSLTGKFISRGDMVFMPASRSRTPASEGAMLLAMNVGAASTSANF